MRDVPPVDVDISMLDISRPKGVVEKLQADLFDLTVLDSYTLNIFPKSLLPTAVYISLLAVLGWFISDLIWKHLSGLGEAPLSGPSTDCQRSGSGLVGDKKQS